MPEIPGMGYCVENMEPRPVILMKLLLEGLRSNSQADEIVSIKASLAFFCDMTDFCIQQLWGEECLLRS